MYFPTNDPPTDGRGRTFPGERQLIKLDTNYEVKPNNYDYGGSLLGIALMLLGIIFGLASISTELKRSNDRAERIEQQTKEIK